MPEMTFTVRWPDGVASQCYSPSLVVHDHLGTGPYSVGDFVSRSRTALTIASERVRAKYGFACTSAMDQLEQIEQTAARFDRSAQVTVLELSS
ncbi:MAG: MSMEG_0570 family nitrogen starvation response protein [Frankiales bacterium]|nr:MSMEG_0570 family nitrogen starvation response protein [Frankiales bacterium]